MINMNILIFTNSFVKINEATSKIVSRFVLALQKENNDILIITNNQKEESYSFNDNIEVVCLGKKDTLLNKIKRKLFSLFLPRDIFPYKSIKKKSKLPVNKFLPDIIVSFSGAFWTQKIGSFWAKKRRIPFYSFYTDPFACTKTNPKHNRPISLLKHIEKKWLKTVRSVMMPSNYKEEYDKIYPDFRHIFQKVELPCFLDNSDTPHVYPQQKKELLYAGGLYSEIRDVSKVIEFSDYLLKNNSEYCVTLLTDEYHKFDKTSVVAIPRKEGKEYVGYLLSCSGLIIVDNNVGIQIPSKVFEFISTGKPIILFFKNSKSKTLSILKKYKNSILLDSNTCGDKDYEKALLFAKKTKTLPKEYLIENFKEYSFEVIYHKFKEIIEI